ncbi:MAG: glycosyltransferase family 4 protein [Anaerolineales bacterium]|nr:glycosyltransferase family 4 protein [Anaerolineales bacterium]
MNTIPSRIGFVSTRFCGTDGVSLEAEKWAAVFNQMGHECFYFSGESDRPEKSSVVVPEAHFKHPDIETINRDLFDDISRSSETSGLVQAIRFHLKKHLYQFLRTFDINVLVIENAFALPMNVPLGLALSEFIAETNIPAIAHHHDFTWERNRFAVNAAGDYLRSSFPPVLPSIHHVVINSFAAQQLALRTGARSLLIPNVMDFDNPPPPPDEYALDLRESFGIGPEQHFLLQPTRIVPRKRIELAIELTRRVDSDSVLVITHQSGDEGSTYEQRVREYADLLDIRVIFGSKTVNHQRGETGDGRKIYSLADAYQQADLVTYPSTIEGFGNAFLETLYYSRPLVISNYAIFKTDIQPKGFRVIGFDDFIEDETVKKAMEILADPSIGEEMAEHNYQIARRHYSYRTLENNLATVLNQCMGS